MTVSKKMKDFSDFGRFLKIAYSVIPETCVLGGGFMNSWLYEFMALWMYGFMDLWIHGFMALVL